MVILLCIFGLMSGGKREQTMCDRVSRVNGVMGGCMKITQGLFVITVLLAGSAGALAQGAVTGGLGSGSGGGYVVGELSSEEVSLDAASKLPYTATLKTTVTPCRRWHCQLDH
jgi:hypothetical protein